MKIVHINTTDNRGGAAQIALLLHTELNKISGIESRMLVREKNTDDTTIASFGVTGWRKWWSILTARDHTFLGEKELLNHPWIQDADIIHLHNLHGYYFHLPLLKKLAQTKKIIWTLHDMWTMTGHCGSSLASAPDTNGLYACQGQFEYVPILLPRSRALGLSKKSILSDIDITYVTPSKWLQDKFKNSHLQKHECLCIANAADASIFHNQKDRMNEIREKLGLAHDAHIALFIANNFNDPVKGGDTIKKLFNDERLADVQFIAVGNGTLPSNPRLTALPYTRDKNELAEYYAAADVYLHPALADNFPSVVIESLLCGTPVVAYDVGGLREQLRDGLDGQIAAPSNYEAFVGGIVHIFTQTPATQAISSRACNEFSADRMRDQYLEIYREIIKK